MGESQTGIKIAGRNTNNLRYSDDITLRAESEEESSPSSRGSSSLSAIKCQISFSWAPESLQLLTEAMKLKDTCSLEEKL